MDNQVTESAEMRIESIAGSESAVIRLACDSKGCGCGVNGLPALWIVSAKETDDVEIQSSHLHFIIHRLQAVFSKSIYTWTPRKTIHRSGYPGTASSTVKISG